MGDLHPDLGGSLLSVQDAAEWCDVSEKTIYRAITAGKLQSLRAGNRHRIRPESLLAYLDRED